MTDGTKDANGGGGLLNLENELTCSICTDILYQPLTLLDCLHTFCGGCSREWFAWQAASAATNHRTANPYTCPSCRESVRGTKADWRMTALLEGFLKANPDRSKSEEEKEEMRKHYVPGEDILPPVRIERDDEDSENEQLLADVRELSMANVDPETARRRAERAARERHRRRQEPRTSPQELGRQQQPSRWVAQHAERQREEERHVEHQPSLRSLLSGSEITSEDVQEEILQSIHAEGLLSGIDIDNLTPQQEEELTERIAEAYRRRQRNRERSRNRDRSRNNERTATNEHSPRQASVQTESPARTQPRVNQSPPQQHQQQQQHTTRSRPPISRPHLFEQSIPSVERHHTRSSSSISHRRQVSAGTAIPSDINTSAARSATDLSLNPSSEDRQRQRPRASSSNARSSTDPPNMRDEVQRLRHTSESLRSDSAGESSRPRSRESNSHRRDTGPTNIVVHPTSVEAPEVRTPHANSRDGQFVRPVPSHSAFAPEPVASAIVQEHSPTIPTINCSRCQRAHIETQLHYNCGTCDQGHFYLCFQCYRAGQGCKHWFGFGALALENWKRAAPPEGWPRGYERPHILMARKYLRLSHQDQDVSIHPSSRHSKTETLQEGAFCESCYTFANSCYWYCQICLDGAWGFCDACVHQGKHCTHPLLPLVHISRYSNSRHDPSRVAFVPAPHLKQHSYILLPVNTDCDVCHIPIPAEDSRYHCFKCRNGDYDICNQCYHKLVSMGKISQDNGPNGWRRCLQGHRMAILGYQGTFGGGGKLRVTYRDPVGGWRLKEEDANAPPPSNLNGNRSKHWSIWSWFPDDVEDGLSLPRAAEIREVENLNADWSIGVYAGRVGLFPSSYTRKI